LRFREWLQEKYADFFDHAKPPTFYGKKLTTSDGIPQFNQTPAVSKDGKKIYYMSDKRGPTAIYEYEVDTQKSHRLISLEWSLFENIHQEERGLSLSRDGSWLAFAGEKGQRDFLYLFNLENKKLKRVKNFYRSNSQSGVLSGRRPPWFASEWWMDTTISIYQHGR